MGNRVRKRWNTFGDVGRATLMTAATILPELPRSKRPHVSVGFSLLSVKLAVSALKKLLPEERPDRKDDESFPSEHAAECVASALIIGREFPGRIAASAYVLATAVAVSRIAATRHHPRDVIAGAAIGAIAVWTSAGIRAAADRSALVA